MPVNNTIQQPVKKNSINSTQAGFPLKLSLWFANKQNKNDEIEGNVCGDVGSDGSESWLAAKYPD